MFHLNVNNKGFLSKDAKLSKKDKTSRVTESVGMTVFKAKQVIKSTNMCQKPCSLNNSKNAVERGSHDHMATLRISVSLHFHMK